MDENVEYKGKISYDVFEAAQYLFNGHRWLTLLITPVFTVLAGFVLCKSYLEWFILLSLGLMSIPVLHAYQKWKWRYHYKRSPYLSEPLKGSVTKNGIITEVPSGKSETPWPNFIKFKSTEDLMLLYIAPNAFKTLSKEFFASSEDWEKARQLVRNGLKNTPNTPGLTVKQIMRLIILFSISILLAVLYSNFLASPSKDTYNAPANHLVKKGDRFTVTKDIDATGLTVWGAPYTGSFNCTLPSGTILVADHNQVPTAEGFGVVPEKYKEMEKQLVPESDRNQRKYGGYYFVFLKSDIGEKIFRIGK